MGGEFFGEERCGERLWQKEAPEGLALQIITWSGWMSCNQLTVMWPNGAFQILSLHFNSISIRPVSLKRGHSNLEVKLSSGGCWSEYSMLTCTAGFTVVSIIYTMWKLWEHSTVSNAFRPWHPWRVKEDFLVGSKRWMPIRNTLWE